MDAVKNAGVLLASGARTATTTTDAQDALQAMGIVLYVDWTVQAGAETITPTIQAQDPASGKWMDFVIPSAALSAVGVYVLVAYPAALTGHTVANFTKSNAVLPRTWRLVITHSSTGAHTYSVGFNYLV